MLPLVLHDDFCLSFVTSTPTIRDPYNHAPDRPQENKLSDIPGELIYTATIRSYPSDAQAVANSNQHWCDNYPSAHKDWLRTACFADRFRSSRSRAMFSSHLVE